MILAKQQRSLAFWHLRHLQMGNNSKQADLCTATQAAVLLVGSLGLHQSRVTDQSNLIAEKLMLQQISII